MRCYHRNLSYAVGAGNFRGNSTRVVYSTYYDILLVRNFGAPANATATLLCDMTWLEWNYNLILETSPIPPNDGKKAKG